MGARFKSHINIGIAGQFTGLPQGMDLSMGGPGTAVPSFTDNGPISHDDASDSRIGRGLPLAPFCQHQGTPHELFSRINHLLLLQEIL
jgi:hypothetical protein